MSCDVCELLKGKKIFEDSKVAAVLAPKPAQFGHLLLFPKEHHTILEQIPDFEIEHLGIVANKLSVALFDSMKIQGTNIVVQNGVDGGQQVPHCIMHIIPRMENDGLDLTWQPRQLSEEEMSTIELKLKEHTDKIGDFELEKQLPINLDYKEKIKAASEVKEAKEDYLVRQLRRIP
ncbi:MAG: HIT family protein [Candidatus Woesearchaeota archaeon]